MILARINKQATAILFRLRLLPFSIFQECNYPDWDVEDHGKDCEGAGPNVDRSGKPQRKIYHRHLPMIAAIAVSMLLSWQARQWSVWILFEHSFSGHGLRSLHSRQT